MQNIKPSVETSVTRTKRVSVTLTQEQVVEDWLIRHVPQFRGMSELDFTWHYYEGYLKHESLSVSAQRVTEGK